MSYCPWLDEDALRQMTGLPVDAFDALVRVLARICEDPYDRMFSVPLSADDRERLAEIGDSGFLEFTVDEAAGLIHVFRLVWTG